MEASMATKKPEFDLVQLNFGWRKFAVPADAAMEIFKLFSGYDVYEIDDKWVPDSGNKRMAKLLDITALPTIATLGPVHFHQMLEMGRMDDEEKEAKRKAKDND
jgi:hypothetical protein